MMGDGNMYWWDALDKLGGVNLWEVRHEGVGLGMADGWARHRHDVGVCTATCGPGVTQLATAFVTAARAQSPLVAFVGEFPRRDQDYVQTGDQLTFAHACEAGFIRIETPEYTDEAIRKAFYLARLESRPIMLSAPMDVQQAKFEDDDVRAVFDAVRVHASHAPGRRNPPESRRRDCAGEEAGDRRRSRRDGRVRVIQSLAKRTARPVRDNSARENWMSDEDYYAGISGLYATKTAMQYFHEADLVIAVGASMNRYTTEHATSIRTRVTSISIQAACDDGHGSLGGYLPAYRREARRRSARRAARQARAQKRGLSHRRRAGASGEPAEDRTEFDVEPGTMDPRALRRAIDDVIPENIAICGGSGTSSGFATMNLTKQRPFYHTAQFFGCIGQMLPAAMGIIPRAA